MSEENFDAIIIGGGAAGLSCALALHQRGLRPVILEKAPQLGGGTSLSYGLIWVGMNPTSDPADERDSRDSVIEYMDFLGAGELDHDRMLAFVDEAPEAIEFLRSLGIRLRNAKGIPDHYYGIAPSGKKEGRSLEFELISGHELGTWTDRILLPVGIPFRVLAQEAVAWGGMHTFDTWDKQLMASRERDDVRGLGVGLISWLVKMAVSRGIDIRTGTPVDALEHIDGHVAGVVTQDGSRIHSRYGVVIASGGYESNPDLVAKYETLPDLRSMFPDTITGDGLLMATEIGGQLKRTRNNLAVFLGFSNPDEAATGTAVCRLSGIWELCLPHSFVVNAKGHRFADETFFQSIVPSLQVFDIRLRKHTNLPAYLIFDTQFAEQYSLAGRVPGGPVPPWVAQSGTITGLAKVLGIDAENLQTTQARFNQFCEGGSDEDFNRGGEKWKLAKSDLVNPALGTVDRPPFYGIKLHPTLLASVGLLADRHARVMHVRGHPIGGLYAIGNAAAHTEYGAGYQAGISLGSAITFGHIAAKHIAADRSAPTTQ